LNVYVAYINLGVSIVNIEAAPQSATGHAAEEEEQQTSDPHRAQLGDDTSSFALAGKFWKGLSEST
jgi:hypothetical protein